MTITVDGREVQISAPGQAVSIIQDIAGRVTQDRLAFREAKIRMGWIFNLVREEWAGLSMDEFCELCRVNRRTAYHAMKIAAEVGDDRGRFSPAKYRELCRRRRVRPAAKPEELSLAKIEEHTGLRSVESSGVHTCAHEDNAETPEEHGAESASVHTCAHLAERLRALAAALVDPSSAALIAIAGGDEMDRLEESVFAAERAAGVVLGVI